jgi:hypothetical protein
MPLLTVYGY